VIEEEEKMKKRGEEKVDVPVVQWDPGLGSLRGRSSAGSPVKAWSLNVRGV